MASSLLFGEICRISSLPLSVCRRRSNRRSAVFWNFGRRVWIKMFHHYLRLVSSMCAKNFVIIWPVFGVWCNISFLKYTKGTMCLPCFADRTSIQPATAATITNENFKTDQRAKRDTCHNSDARCVKRNKLFIPKREEETIFSFMVIGISIAKSNYHLPHSRNQRNFGVVIQQWMGTLFVC